MRAVVQRVAGASVDVDGEVVGEIGRGLAVLVGYGEGDSSEDVAFMADKIANLRVFEDEEGKMNLSVLEIGGGVLLVPNFTLYGDCRKGRRPSFTAACAPGPAEAMFQELAEEIANRHLQVERGVFGARMSVALVNDGPVTLLVSSEGTF
ncbi:MAG: D-aminoacyl-tRNA deacylase [Armatimonadota bacterium]|nr:D-aminoacyl-tRNA deacylase [Armatimonadota bacterium]